MSNTAELQAFDDHLVRFEQFVRFYCKVMQRPDPLRDADCRESFREDVPHYYESIFGKGVSGLTSRHLKWLRRLTPVLQLPKGASILDFGGGYGLDSILLAACGYDVVFFEVTPHHIGVCGYLRKLWEQELGELRLRSVLATKSGGADERRRWNAGAIGTVSAVLLNEVAHHIEPVSDVFSLCADVLPRGGELFLLEPNYWSPISQAYFFRVRGFRTIESHVDEETGETYLYGNENIRPRHRWQRLAADAGFRLRDASYVVPFLMNSRASAHAGWRAAAQTLPLVKDIAATHITFRFARA